MSDQIHQLLIVQLSDIHFGSSHGFGVELDPNGKPLSGLGSPDLWDLLKKDLNQDDPKCAVMVAITGDMVSKALSINNIDNTSVRG